MAIVRREVKEISIDKVGVVPLEVFDSEEPLILRGLAAEWPIVKQGRDSIGSVSTYLRQYYTGKPITYYQGPGEFNGRLFYNNDFSDFNFKQGNADLNHILKLLEQSKEKNDSSLYYVGSTRIEEWFPGLFENNNLTLPESINPLISIWFGSRSVIAAHYDCPNNIACNVAGKRTFTLFPPDQLENLYVGPLDFTPSGRPISMVDLTNPDFSLYPKFEKALEAAVLADLEVGDGLYIPGMWWHNVQAHEDFNVLINYWWREVPLWMGNPENALYHALLSLRGLSKSKRDIWKNIFDFYIFDAKEESLKHIPEKILGVLSTLDEVKAREIRMYLAHKFK